jgi:DNA-binding transcriptional MocR family regulator
MLTVPLTNNGPDIESLKLLMKTNENIVGMLCVPRHSNPSGEVYSDSNLRDIFNIGRSYSKGLPIHF